ncbi:phosphoadenosine phosphosulfate reductase family protein [Deinococcus misasensis]|uniref:phosphoadenosine phosphosulfate reductase domain-containing protein n=1 Tax=Deinococcus misasensis TaxID=392413 RepID=UPI0009FF0477|nr:phosphoadenosine phosphosulfate reductase family protein [Deinococcus misasensis]
MQNPLFETQWPPDEVQDLIRAGALIVSNHSGGKDSQAMLIELLKISPAAQMLVVHASLGEMEWPGALEHAEQQARNAGLPFVVARANKTLLGMVEARFDSRPDVPSWPSAQHRQCTSDLKRGPIEREVRRYAKEHGFQTIINCVGLRAEESPRRAKAITWRKNETNTTQSRAWFDWLPIHHFNRDQVFEAIREAGQELHPAYGLGNDRLSCVFCILANSNDLRNGAVRNPELYQRYVELEQKTGYTMHQSRRSLPEITGIHIDGCSQEGQRTHEKKPE